LTRTIHDSNGGAVDKEWRETSTAFNWANPAFFSFYHVTRNFLLIFGFFGFLKFF